MLESLMRRKRLLARHALAPAGETPDDASALEEALRLGPTARNSAEDINAASLASLAQGGMDDGVELLTWLDGGSGHVLLARDARGLSRARKNCTDVDAVIAKHTDDRSDWLIDQTGPPVIWAGGELATLWPEFVATGAASA